MIITVDPTASEPPFEQVKRQVTEQVTSGGLKPGDKLPTVRCLAADLGLAPNTVARAYRELEALGVIDTRGRSGTYVSGDKIARAAREAAAAYVERTRALGVDSAEALALVRRGLGLS